MKPSPKKLPSPFVKTTEEKVNRPVEVWMIEDNHAFRNTVSRLLNQTEDIRCTQAFPACEDALALLQSGATADVIGATAVMIGDTSRMIGDTSRDAGELVRHLDDTNHNINDAVETMELKPITRALAKARDFFKACLCGGGCCRSAHPPAPARDRPAGADTATAIVMALRRRR